MDEKRLFIVGLKLIGVMNILGGIVAFNNFIPGLPSILSHPTISNQFATLFYRTIEHIIQVALGVYLLKDGQAVVNFAYEMKSK